MSCIELITDFTEMSDIPPPKPWSIAVFETRRSHLTSFVREQVAPLIENELVRRLLIRAPVKSGKREMVEYMAMRDQVHSATRVHAFISAWHRTADDEQRHELREHNVHVFSIVTSKHVAACLQWIQLQIGNAKKVVIHLDECDHGSGDKQMLSKLWPHIRNNPAITTILYSATPEEVLFSGEVEDPEYQEMVDAIIQSHPPIKYTPPEGYCGPAAFLSAGLVQDATPFFQTTGGVFSLTTQGKEIIRGLRASMVSNPSRNIVVLRLSYVEEKGTNANRKKNKAIYKFLENLSAFTELSDFLVVVDKVDAIDSIRNPAISTEKIQWSNKFYWDRQTRDRPILIVIDQTSSRSTEWACHNRIFVTHDYRNTVTFSVVSQAQERVNHYTQKYGGQFQPIQVYGHKKSFYLSAGQITYADYLKSPWTMRKVDRRTAGDTVVFTIRNTDTNAQHETHNRQYTEAEAIHILRELSSHVEISVSSRVCGGVKQLPLYDSFFVPCTQETFQAEMSRELTRRNIVRAHYLNPFDTSIARSVGVSHGGMWMGYLRGWGVWQYERDVRSMRWGGSNRMTICYKDGELGVAYRYKTGAFEMIDTLQAYKSMYGA